MRKIIQFLVKIIMFIFRILPIDENKIVFCAFTARTYGDNPKYIAEYILNHDKNMKCFFALKKPKEFEVKKGVRKIKYNSLPYLYHMATAKFWVDNTRKPSYIIKRNKQFYIQTWHAGIALKKIEKDVEKSLDEIYIKTAICDSKKIDLLLTNSDCGYNQLRNCFWYNGEIAKTGSPRLDILFSSDSIKEKIKEKIGISKEKKVVLYCPTFRRDHNLDAYNLDYERLIKKLQEKFKNEWEIIIKLHPNIKDLDVNIPKYVKNVSSYPDINELYLITDILITDYSSSMLDYSITKRIAFIFATDYDKYALDRDTYFDIKHLPFPFSSSNNELIKNIDIFDLVEYNKKLTDFHKQLGIIEDGKACERVYKRIMKEKKMKKINRKNNSRLKKATLSILLLGTYQIVLFICNLILPRLILKTYGSEYNGIISSITQFVSFISILRLGVAGATRVELYKSLANDDIEKTSSIVRATEKYMRKISLIFLGYIFLLAIIYPFVITTNHSWLDISSLVIIISLGTFAQYFFGITYSTLLQADQRLYIHNIIQIICTIGNTIIACVLMKLGFSIQIVKLFSAIIFTMNPLVLNIYVSKRYHLNKKAKPDDSGLKKRGDVAAHSIANIVHENTDVVVLTLLTNIKIVSVYSIYNLVMNGLKQIVTIFTSGLESPFGDMWVKNEKDNMKQKLNLFEYFICSLISVVFSCSFILIIPFVKLYTKGVTDINYIVPQYALLALIAQAFYYFRIPYLTVTQAAGKYKETKNGAILEAVINISLSVVLTIKLGLLGVVIGTLSANLFRTIQYSIFTSNELKLTTIKEVSKKLIWTILNLVVSYLIIRLIVNRYIVIYSWIDWIKVGLISFVISSLVLIINSLVFYKKEFLTMINIVKKIIIKKKKVAVSI